MRRGFSVTELLVVLGVLAIAAGLLLPALARAQGASLQATCMEREHHVGIGLASCRLDHDDHWNLAGCTMLDHTGEFLAFALDGGYIGDPQYLVCPDLDTPHPRKPHLFGKGLTRDWGEKPRWPIPNGKSMDWWGIEEMTYFFDEFRVDENSNPSRAILADGIEMCTKYGPEPANHPDGANVLYLDQAVQWVSKVQPEVKWQKVEGQYAVGGGKHACAATKGPWERYGYIPNPRLSEDGVADDLDDIYECEGTPPEHNAKFPGLGVRGSAKPDVANAFFSYAKEHRCDQKQMWGYPSKTDCAVAGGLALRWWDTWRGGMRDASIAAGYSWYKDHGPGYEGVTWGCPAEFEGHVWDKW